MALKWRHSGRFAHMVFFALTDLSEPTITAFVEACRKYLARHKGQIHFSLGLRAVDITRDVSDTNFDMAMHMIFESRADYDRYEASRRHSDFITATAGMSIGRKVLDSYLVADDGD